MVCSSQDTLQLHLEQLQRFYEEERDEAQYR